MTESEKLTEELIDATVPETSKKEEISDNQDPSCCVRFFNAVSNVPKHLAKVISVVDLNSMR